MTTLNGRRTLADAAPRAAEHGALAALYRPLVHTLLGMPCGGGGDRSLLVGLTACGRGEGVTTVAIHLAWSAADELSQGVALVDANAANPALGPMLALEQPLGLADAIASGQDPSHFAESFLLDNLRILASGSPDARSRLFADPSRFGTAIDGMRAAHRLVICDLPPLYEADGLWEALSQFDGLLLVVDAQRTRREAVNAAARRVAAAGGRLWGAILNKATIRPAARAAPLGRR